MSEQVDPRGLRGRHEDLFRLLVESVKDYAIFLLDPNGYIRSWNEGAARIKGYSAKEIIGKHFSTFYSAQEVRRGKPEYELRVAADEGRWEEEGWRIRKDGGLFWASVVITALYDPQGTLLGFAKVTRDLTERRRAEEDRLVLLERERAARAEAEQRLEQLRTIQEVTEAALTHITLDDLLQTLLGRIVEILVVDTVTVLLTEPEGDVLVVRATTGMEAEVGYGIRIPIGYGFSGRVAGERRPILMEDIAEGELQDASILHQGIRALLGVPLMTEGQVIGVLHVGTRLHRRFLPTDVQFLQVIADRVALTIEHTRLVDVARAARVDAEVAERTLQAQDEFLSVAAHELKTPLTGARLASQLLRRRLDRLPPDLRSSIETIDLQVDKLGRLVTQLLDTVRLQAGRLVLTREDADVAALARVVVEQMRLRAAGHEILVTAEGPLIACLDAPRLKQVLTNLLDNAIKFSPDGAVINVAVERTASGKIRLAVRDRGPGIPIEQRPHIFERYFQAHAENHQSGLGLGLYICRQIVVEHGGEIVAEFPRDGGVRFVVTLPMGQGEAVVPEPAR